jgi:integrase
MPTVRKRGKTWNCQVRIKENGKVVYQESATRDTKAAAQLWGLQREEEIKRDGWKKTVVNTTTVGQLLEKYSAQRAKVKAVSRGFQHSIDNVTHSDLGRLALTELSSDKIIDWAMERHEAGNSPATVMHHLATLSAAINAAEVSFGIKADATPVKLAIKRLKQLRVAAPSLKRDNRVTDADLAEILPAFESELAFIPMAKIVRLAIALPRRREELLSMRWDNLRPDGTIKLVDTKDPRKYREEIVPVPPAAATIIAELPKLGDVILPYKPESVSARWQRAVRRVGKPHLRYHDLRHEGISRLFEQGLTIEEVALISGHTSWATLRRYTHLRPQSVTEKLRNASRQGT